MVVDDVEALRIVMREAEHQVEIGMVFLHEILCRHGDVSPGRRADAGWTDIDQLASEFRIRTMPGEKRDIVAAFRRAAARCHT
ncbi:hypothetical protein GCM10020255_014630 [Rhodococcus baikonurensis]